MKTALFANKLRGLKAYYNGTFLGNVEEFYFDDQTWNVRYLVLDVGHRHKNRKVLISPAALEGIDCRRGIIRLGLTDEQVERSPDASVDMPVARALEARFPRRFSWGVAWPESFMGTPNESVEFQGRGYDPHLRSTEVLTGTALVADPDVAGKVVDFLVDPELWRIEYVAADFGGLHAVLVDPKLVRSIDVGRRELRIEPLES